MVSVALALSAMMVGLPANAAPLTPAVHGDFEHYTFALTWQPGFCGSEEGCLPDQPKTALIGIHGLWASLPQTLVDQGLPMAEWFGRGCDVFGPSEGAPALDPAIAAQLDAFMPHIAHSLLTHEYDKHVKCFGFDPNQFFSTELAMRATVVAGPFGHYLSDHVGQSVSHADVTAAFEKAFSTDLATSLQLQCEHNAQGGAILSQFWFTLHADKLAEFPQTDAFMTTPTAQYEDNCPTTFLIPSW